jgi:uncharacterized cupin superfamily protein
MKRADLSKLTPRVGASYPDGLNARMAGRTTWQVTKLYGKSQFGVNRVELKPARGRRIGIGIARTTKRSASS